eukprot:XP_014622765.1 mitochondrial outer membrane protein porin 5 isoform X5 [Glycine max]
MEKGLYKPLFGCWCFCAAAKMSGKGPGFFSEIGKRGRDILTKDYNSDQRFTISSSTNSGLDLKSTLVKSRGLSSGDVAAEFKYKNKAVNVKVDTESNVLTTFTVSDVVPSAKTIASIRLPDYSSGKVEVQYLHEHVAFTLGVGLDRSPVIDFSGTMGTPSIAFGAETSYSTSVGKFMKYNAGLCLKMPSSNASVILYTPVGFNHSPAIDFLGRWVLPALSLEHKPASLQVLASLRNTKLVCARKSQVPMLQ